MKPNHIQMEIDGDLFSGLEDPEAEQPSVNPYDKIIESRKNTTFAAEKFEYQDEVQVVEKSENEEAPKAAPIVEEKPKIEYHIYPLEEAPFERIKLLISAHMTMIVCPPDYATAFTATHPLMCRAFADFAGRLKEQYRTDRPSLKKKLMQYTECGGSRKDSSDDKGESQ